MLPVANWYGSDAAACASSSCAGGAVVSAGCAVASVLVIPRRVGVLDLPSALRVAILRDGVKGAAAGDAGCDPKMFCMFCCKCMLVFVDCFGCCCWD